MLCTTCLGVLEECRNPIVVDHYWCHFPETTAGKSIFRQGTIDITTPQSGHERTALFENTTSSTAPDSFATSSDEGELAQHFCSDSQPVTAGQSECSDDASNFGRHAIYGHHATLADLKTAASQYPLVKVIAVMTHTLVGMPYMVTTPHLRTSRQRRAVGVSYVGRSGTC